MYVRTEKGSLRKSQAFDTHLHSSPQRGGPLPGHRPLALEAESQLDQDRDRTYLHGDPAYQSCPGPKEAQCG